MSKFTKATYERHDREYKEKAIDALMRMDYGQNATVEFAGDRVIVNSSNIIGFDELAVKAIDRQADLTERPNLEQVYRDRQQRVEVANKTTTMVIEKSEEQIMQEQAQKYMKANSRNNRYRNPNEVQSEGLPSERGE